MRAGDYDALGDAQLVIITAGVNERAVLPVAAYSPRYDVTLSLVSMLGAVGVQQMHEPPMTSDERVALEQSAAALRESASRVLSTGR